MMLASLSSQGGLEDGRAGDFVSPLFVLFVPKLQLDRHVPSNTSQEVAQRYCSNKHTRGDLNRFRVEKQGVCPSRPRLIRVVTVDGV